MFNIKNSHTLDQNYAAGLLPQRNSADVFYDDSSCRSNLENFSLSSENRRILRKTDEFEFSLIPLNQYKFDIDTQKTIFQWIKGLGWDFPISSVKQIFSHHIFNHLYIWKKDNHIVAYSICYFSETISHIGYVFYDPQYSHSDLPIRLVLQIIIDSQQKNLKYAYLGRYSSSIGYYKRNMPGFEYFDNQQWQKF
jgi:arginyl-tRNA--protein-N-Asp/Glu arginylyltransferase